MTQRFRLVLFLAVLSAVVNVAPASANLLVNGSFEIWSGGDQSSASQPDRIFNDGSLSVTGWNFAIGLSSDLYRDFAASGALSNYYNAHHEDYFAGSGSFDTLHEGISQTFVVAPNTLYELNFKMAPGGLNYNGSWIENASISSSWKVDLTGALLSPVTQTFNTNLSHFDASGTTNPLIWTNKTLLFQSNPVGGNVTVRFTAFGDMTHVFLDNCVAIAAGSSDVPEPGTLGTALVMLGFVACSRRARRKRRG